VAANGEGQFDIYQHDLGVWPFYVEPGSSSAGQNPKTTRPTPWRSWAQSFIPRNFAPRRLDVPFDLPFTPFGGACAATPSGFEKRVFSLLSDDRPAAGANADAHTALSQFRQPPFDETKVADETERADWAGHSDVYRPAYGEKKKVGQGACSTWTSFCLLKHPQIMARFARRARTEEF